MTIHVDTSDLPVVRIVFIEDSTDAEWEVYHAEMNRLMLEAERTGRKIGFIMDGRRSHPPTALQRRGAAAALERQSHLMKMSVVGMALVLSSALQRGVVTALLWVKPFAVPHMVCATSEEGEAWLRESLPKPTGDATTGK